MKLSAATSPDPPETIALPPPPVATVYGIVGWRRALLLPFGWLLRLWGATLRFEISAETGECLRKIDQPVVFVLWHNRLFLVSEVFRRYRQGKPVYGLVSASRDGAWLAAFFSLIGIRSVRGSSSRLGREAVTALVDVVRTGNDIGITPDGPRGPLYDFKSGALIVARRAKAPVLLLGAVYESSWRLNSWDRFHLPKPFSRVRLFCSEVRAETLREPEHAAPALRDRLMAMSPDTSSSGAAITL